MKYISNSRTALYVFALLLQSSLCVEATSSGRQTLKGVRGIRHLQADPKAEDKEVGRPPKEDKDNTPVRDVGLKVDPKSLAPKTLRTETSLTPKDPKKKKCRKFKEVTPPPVPQPNEKIGEGVPLPPPPTKEAAPKDALGERSALPSPPTEDTTGEEAPLPPGPLNRGLIGEEAPLPPPPPTEGKIGEGIPLPPPPPTEGKIGEGVTPPEPPPTPKESPPTQRQSSPEEELTCDDFWVDCPAIEKDVGPKDSTWVRLIVNTDVVTADTTGVKSVYTDMESDLQKNVAPEIAGCPRKKGLRRELVEEDDSSFVELVEESSIVELLEEEESSIVNVDFETPELDEDDRCPSNLAMQAANAGDNCFSTDVPVTVYYVGEQNMMDILSRVRSAMTDHNWQVNGMRISSVGDIDIISSSEQELGAQGLDAGEEKETDNGPTIGIGGAAAAIIALILVCLYCRNRRTTSTEEEDAKAIVDTESDTDEENEKAQAPRAIARPIYSFEPDAVEVSQRNMKF